MLWKSRELESLVHHTPSVKLLKPPWSTISHISHTWYREASSTTAIKYMKVFKLPHLEVILACIELNKTHAYFFIMNFYSILYVFVLATPYMFFTWHFTQLHQPSITWYVLGLVHNITLAPRASRGSRKSFFTSQIASPTLNFSIIWLVGHWLMLATLHWNRNRVYSSVTPTLATLHWHERHIVNQALITTELLTDLVLNWASLATVVKLDWSILKPTGPF